MNYLVCEIIIVTSYGIGVVASANIPTGISSLYRLLKSHIINEFVDLEYGVISTFKLLRIDGAVLEQDVPDPVVLIKTMQDDGPFTRPGNVLQVDVYVRDRGLKQLRDHRLGQPDRFAFEQDTNRLVALCGLVQDDLTLWPDGAGVFAHSVTSASMSGCMPLSSNVAVPYSSIKRLAKALRSDCGCS